MRTCQCLIAACLVLLVGLPAHARGDHPELAPFTAARFQGDVVEVEVNDTWYRLLAIDKVKADDLVAFAQKTYRRKWKERIVEDLVEVLARMGKKPGDTVTLKLETLDNGKPVTLRKVPMTRENRARAREAFEANEDDDEDKRRRSRRKDDDDFEKAAPFTAARVEDDKIIMQVQGTWYELVSIDGIGAKRMIDFAHRTYGGRMEKRIVEDLVQVMTEMGKAPGRTVALQLVRVDDGKSVSLPAVPMTEANRKQAWRTRGLLDRGGTPVRRGRRRVHRKEADPEFAHLATAVEGARGSPKIPRAALLEDLDQLEWLVKNVHAYATLRGVDLEAAVDAVRLSIGARMSRNAFAIQVMKLLALLGDGHARVSENPSRVLAPGFLPFLVSDVNGRPVAYSPDRQLHDRDYPYVATIDGVPWQKWVEAASRVVANGSPQLVRRRAWGIVRHVNHVRRELGLPEKSHVMWTLESADGKPHETRNAMEVAKEKPLYGSGPYRATRLLKEHNIGYLRIEQMLGKKKSLADLVKAMDSFQHTKGLIIDVRGNGGGTREPLRVLLPYFLGPSDAVVVNVAAYRLPQKTRPNDEGYLQDRHLYPATASVWSAEDRQMIDAVAKSFRPAWELPDSGFSPWHYFVVRGGGKDRYTKPVVVLIDSGCFSATDIFVSGMASVPQVTLMGTATSGGSGRGRSYRLANSGIRLRLSSMASFRTDGAPFDTKGIAPHVEVPGQPLDLTGITDTVLDAAIERLR